MRLSLHAIGLTTALLLGVVDVNAHLDLLNDSGSLGGSTIHEIRALDVLNREASTLASSAVTTGTSTQNASTETEAETNTAEEGVAIEEVKPLTHTAELKANLYEIEKALKESTLAVAEVLNGVISLVAPIANIGNSAVNLGITLAKVFWFSGKVLYNLGAVIAEGVQTAHAFLTK
jgi:hypothetical protein